MLLTIHNLPWTTRYMDVKALLQEKCGLTELILDNLVNEGHLKKVTVGLADEGDAAILVRKINGLYVNGQQLYVEDKRKKQASDQPYRSTAIHTPEGVSEYDIPENHQPMIPNQAMFSNMHMNPMIAPQQMVTYNMEGMYYTPMEQNRIGYGGALQYLPATGPQDSDILVQNKQGSNALFQGEVASNVFREPILDREMPMHGDRTHRANDRKHRPENIHNYRPSRWDDQGTKFTQNLIPKEKSPVRARQRIWQHENEQYQSQKDHNDFYSIDQNNQIDSRVSEHRNSNEKSVWNQESKRQWDSEPNRQWNPETQQWNDPEPYWNSEPDREWNGQLQKQPWDQEQQKPERFAPNSHSLNLPDHYPSQSNDFRERDLSYPGYHRSTSRSRSHKEGKQSRTYERKEERLKHDSRDRRDKSNCSGSIVQNRAPREADSFPSSSKSFTGKSWQDERYSASDFRKRENFSNLYRESDNEDGRLKYDRSAKRPRDDKRSDEEPRHKKYAADKRETFRSGKEEKVRSGFNENNKNAMPNMRTLINKDHTWRGQATAAIAKEIVRRFGQNNGLYGRDVMNQLKVCIKSRIDVLLGEKMGVIVDDIILSYRKNFPRNGDRAFFNAILDKCRSEASERTQPDISKQEIKKENDSFGAAKEVKKFVKEGNKSDKVEKKCLSDSYKVFLPHSTTVPDNNVLPKYPNGDKWKNKDLKQQLKMEFEQDDLYKLDPITKKALDEELDQISDLYLGSFNAPADNHEKTICTRILQSGAGKLKKVIGLNVTKRILKINTGLGVRIFGAGKLPKRPALNKFLMEYGVMSLKKTDNKKSFIAICKSFPDYDRLCCLGKSIIDGVEVSFKTLHLTGPPKSVPYEEIQARRRDFIKSQIELEHVDHTCTEVETKDEFQENTRVLEADSEIKTDELNDFAADIDVANIKEEDLEDY